MEMIDNVLYSFTWNPSLVVFFLFRWMRCHYLQQFPLTPAEYTITANEQQENLAQNWRDMWNWYPVWRTLHFHHHQNWLWAIYASSCSCYLSEKTNRAANDWMKMQNIFSHIQTNPVAISNCMRRFCLKKNTHTLMVEKVSGKMHVDGNIKTLWHWIDNVCRCTR